MFVTTTGRYGYDREKYIATGVEPLTRWVLDEVAGGSRQKRKRLKRWDNVIGYEFTRGGKQKYVAYYDASPLPRPFQWVVESIIQVRREYARDGSLVEKVRLWLAPPSTYLSPRENVVGYARQTFDGWEDVHMFEHTEIALCVRCVKYWPCAVLKYFNHVVYRGYQWMLEQVFLPKGGRRDNTPVHCCGGYMCPECRKQVTHLAHSMIDLELSITFIKQECLNEAGYRVSLRDATRRRVSKRHGGVDATFTGNVSRLARETFDRRGGAGAGSGRRGGVRGKTR